MRRVENWRVVILSRPSWSTSITVRAGEMYFRMGYTVPSVFKVSHSVLNRVRSFLRSKLENDAARKIIEYRVSLSELQLVSHPCLEVMMYITRRNVVYYRKPKWKLHSKSPTRSQ